jgi:Bacterial protein of unknown function (DUF922)
MMFKMVTALVFSILLFTGPHKEGNSIQWEASRRLAWDDFKSVPDNNSSNAALTSSTLSFKYNYDAEKGFSYSIACLFEKNSSWGKVKTDYILSHEQGHFDIAEICARKLNKTVSAYSFNPATARKEVPDMYQQIMKDLAAMQNQYDSETDFSRDKEEQAAWKIKIKNELEQLKAYANYH